MTTEPTITLPRAVLAALVDPQKACYLHWTDVDESWCGYCDQNDDQHTDLCPVRIAQTVLAEERP